MYDEELDMALEDAYDDGYVQALMDMGVDPDNIAEEDVDMFDDNYFDEAMEGPAREYRHRMNEGKSQEDIRAARYRTRTPDDNEFLPYSGSHAKIYGGNPYKKGTKNHELSTTYNPGQGFKHNQRYYSKAGYLRDIKAKHDENRRNKFDMQSNASDRTGSLRPIHREQIQVDPFAKRGNEYKF